MTQAAFPAERAKEELDPESDQAGLLFDPARTQEWIETFLTIEDPRGRVVRFELFPQQVKMLDEHTGRDVTVKARQTRASSLILARNLRRMTTNWGMKALVMTQDDQTTQLFRARIEHHLRDLKAAGLDYPIVRSNKNEIVIGEEMQSHYIFGSGEERVAGRAYAAQIVHLSEIAHWKPENAGRLMGGITPAVPGPPDGWFDLESTPNGADGEFYDYALDAYDGKKDPLNQWTLHFYSWWLEPRYYVGEVGSGADIQIPPGALQHLVQNFTPDNHEAVLMQEHDLSIQQILWRKATEADLARTGVPFLQEYVEEFDTAFITGEENYFSSLDGIDHLKYYKSQSADPTEKIDSLPWKGAEVSFYGSNLYVWERPDPKHDYVGYVDSAEGGSSRDSDFSALVVVNARTHHHAATLRLKCSPSEMGAMACAVMAFYNTGLLGGERGTYGSATLERIQNLHYPNIYYHVDYDKPAAQPEAWVFPSQARREQILTGFRESVFERQFLTRDATLVSEMGTFSWGKMRSGKMKAQAKRRRHDDMVIAAAGAEFIAIRSGRFTRPRREHEAETLIVGRGGMVISREAPDAYIPHSFLS